MKGPFAVALGILTAIGGFVDIGDLVTSSVTGSRFGMSLAWVLVLGVVGICVFAEMSGRVAAVTGQGTFDLIRERLGPRTGLVNLVASMAITLLTYTANIGGIALALTLVTSVNHLLWAPVVAAVVWIVLWWARFAALENTFGLAGLALLVFAVAVWRLHPDWLDLAGQLTWQRAAGDEDPVTYWYYAVALFGAAMTPYEVFFFSSGGIEERWRPRDLGTMRSNVLVGFPLGGLLSLSIVAVSAVALLPAGIQVQDLGQVGLPVGQALGNLGLAVLLVGTFAATFGASCETGLSIGYSIAQYFGWAWGKTVPARRAARFHSVVLLSTVVAVGVLLTGADPVQVTEYSVVFSALALPLTYFPILVVANDRRVMSDHVNGRLGNALGLAYLVVVVVAAAAAIPLMIASGAGR